MKKIKHTLALLIFLGSSFSFADDFESLSGFHEGSYEVPVKDPNLADYAVFKLHQVHLEQEGNHFKLKYLVPVELTGEENFVEFSGTFENGSGTLTYEKAKMECLADQSTFTCKVAYQDLKMDSKKAEEILTAHLKGEDLQRRLQIQRDFSTDPVGLVKIKLKQELKHHK